MTDNGSRRSPRRRAGYAWLATGPVAAGAIAILLATQPAVAATATVNLGTASSFAVLAGQTVTNTTTGASRVYGNLGVYPGTAVTGFPPGLVLPPGTTHAGDAVAAQAQSDLTTAYTDAAGRPFTASVPGFIGAGQSLAPGVYKASASSLDVGGGLTLNAGGDPNAVWIFQVPSTLVTDSSSSVRLTNGAQACNVFWQVGSSATLGTNSTFVGSVLALTSITVQTNDTVTGRVLARNGQVSLDGDIITPPTTCTTTTPTPTPTATGPTPTPTPTPTGVTIPPITLPIGPITLPIGPITLPIGPITLPTGPVTIPPGPGPRPRPTGPGPRPTGPGPRPTGPGPRPTGPGPRPSPTGTTPSPTGTPTSPVATPTTTSPTPAPTPTSPAPGPAPAPTPVGGTFPVTG